MARQELFKTVGNSDHAMLSSVYMQWDSLIGSERRQYCELMGLSFNVMRDMKQLVSQFDASLASVGYKASVESDHSSQSWRTLRACVVAALAPGQLVRVQRPSTKYAETLGGAKEKETDARELKFFIQVAERRPSNQPGEASGVLFRGYHGVAEESVFVHPSSANFSTGNFSCPWLVYHELVRTSKPFLRDATECSAYALLLFGGKLEVQAGKGLIVVADWVHLSANARIGALVGGLRKTIDKLLAKKIENPIFDITSTTEMKLVRNLIMTDGLGSL
jgi:ATP-dependent RNA helicase DHX57